MHVSIYIFNFYFIVLGVSLNESNQPQPRLNENYLEVILTQKC